MSVHKIYGSGNVVSDINAASVIYSKEMAFDLSGCGLVWYGSDGASFLHSSYYM